MIMLHLLAFWREWTGEGRGERTKSVMADIRLVALDVDGTLVDDEKEIPAANVRALRAALERGVHVAIASGRMVPSIEIMERRLGIDCALIAYNGAKVLGTVAKGRPCIDHQPLPVEVTARVRRFSVEHGLLLNYYFDDVLYAERAHAKNPLAELYHRRTGAVYHFVDTEDIAAEPSTKLILLADPERVKELHAHFSRELDGLINVVITEREYLEFMTIGVDKSTALPILAEYHGVEVEHVLAIGDADNDRLMLRDAGVGVAVANARPEVREVADDTTRRTNNEGAVAEAITTWVFGDTGVDFWQEE